MTGSWWSVAAIHWKVLDEMRYLTTIAIAICLAALVTSAAAPAGARRGVRIAFFTTAIEGTFTSTGHQTDDCSLSGADPTLPPRRFTQVTTVDDRVEFASRSSGVAEVMSINGEPPSAGMTKLMRARAVWTRTRTVDPAGPCRDDDEPDVCGTRTREFGMGVWGRQDRSALAFDIRTRTGPVFPDDPYGYCQLVPEQTSWGKIQALGARVSAAKLFDPHVRRLVVHGREPLASGPQVSRELRYTITLVRKR